MTDDHIVEFRGVKKAFGRKIVYESLDLAVRRSETITVMGGSGSGKSVLLKMLIGLMDHDGGRILFEGRSVVSEKDFAWVRSHVGMLFQGGALFDSLSVGENIAYPLLERRSGSYADVRDVVTEKLSMVGLEGIEELKPAEISGGMQKRVALARAIATEPDVVLYDEPTTGLDPRNANRINHLIVDLQRKLGITSIVVTHDIQSAFEVSDRIALLHERRIGRVDTVERIRSSEDPMVRGFFDGNFEQAP